MQRNGVLLAVALTAAALLSLVHPGDASAQEPNQVTGVTVTQRDGFATLSWIPVSGATDYQIERKPVGVDNVATGRGRVVALLAQAAERFKLMPCGEALPEVENQVVPVAASRPA